MNRMRSRRSAWFPSWEAWTACLVVSFLALPGVKAVAEAIQLGLSSDINSWESTEFLISYASGFVRRGLAGTALLAWRDWLPLPHPLFLTTMLAMLTIISVTYLVVKNVLKLSLFDAWLICYSPLIYPLFVAFDARPAARKDGFVFVFVIVLLWLLRRFQSKRLSVQFVFGLILLPALTFVHEMMPMLLLGPFLLIVFLERRSRSLSVRQSLSVCGVLALPSFLALIPCFLFSRPSPEFVQNMCLSWQAYYPDLRCSLQSLPGAFSTLADYSVPDDMLGWIHTTSRIRLESALAAVYLLAFICAPLGRLASRQIGVGQGRGALISAITAVIVFLPSAPLYWIATDFGRWVANSLTLVVLLICSKEFCRQMDNLVQDLERSIWRVPRLSPALAGDIQSIYSNMNGLLSVVNLFLVVPICCVQFWNFNPLARILLAPYGL
jgi:hypothetical protein